MPTVAQIEDAIIARLTREIPALRACDSLGEYLAARARGLSARHPAAWVVYEGATFQHAMAGVQDRLMTFLVIVSARSFRGEAAARRGAAGEPGAYEVLDAVRAALTGSDCGLPIVPLLPVEEEVLRGEDGYAEYGLHFTTQCRETI